jgi:hypothetical protein
MPRYDYHCEANGRTIEVRHGFDERVETWAQLCERAGESLGDTPPEALVEKVIYAPALSTPKTNSELKGMGFTKLVRRDDGVYENVTAADGDSKVVHRDDPGSIAGLNLDKKIGD